MIGPGDVLRNRYRIEHSIGRGGMGEVFSAVVLLPPPGSEGDPEVTLLRPSFESFRVAIKVVSRPVVTEAAMARLQREAEAAARIRSPFIPELIDVGTTPEGEIFLAMDLLHGETLTARLKARPVLSWDELFLLGDDVLSALIDAHDAGVVHRDLKPSNIFLCAPEPPDGVERAKILDFGVCKLDAPDQEKLTGTGESVGTVAYMAPEQIRGASSVGESADLYSFATVVFEALSGQLPHRGGGQMAILASKLERKALRLAEVAQVPVPDGLDALLARLLERSARDRIATAREVRDAWRALGSAEVAPQPSATSLPTTAGAPATETGLASGTLDIAPPRGSRAGLALAAFGVMMSAVIVVALLVMRRSAPPPAADFMAAQATASVAVLDRPPVASEEPGPARRAPASTAPDAGGWVSEDAATAGAPSTAAAAASGAPAAPRPPRVWASPPTRSTTTKPHIADKPRY